MLYIRASNTMHSIVISVKVCIAVSLTVRNSENLQAIQFNAAPNTWLAQGYV